jgi:hypothetical protein
VRQWDCFLFLKKLLAIMLLINIRKHFCQILKILDLVHLLSIQNIERQQRNWNIQATGTRVAHASQFLKIHPKTEETKLIWRFSFSISNLCDLCLHVRTCKMQEVNSGGFVNSCIKKLRKHFYEDLPYSLFISCLSA